MIWEREGCEVFIYGITERKIARARHLVIGAIYVSSRKYRYLGNIGASAPRYCSEAGVYKHGQQQAFAVRFLLQGAAQCLGNWPLLRKDERLMREVVGHSTRGQTANARASAHIHRILIPDE